MFIPPRIVITKKCKRCQLRYPRKYHACTHCSHLNDSEVDELKSRYKEEHKGNANLGLLFFFFAISLIIWIALL